MKTRTQTQVNALWPADKDAYRMEGTIAVKSKTLSGAVAAVQSLYDGGMAGEFVLSKTGQIRLHDGGAAVVYAVVFTRDVADDIEVLDPVLLDGQDFNTALMEQLAVEINEFPDSGVTLLSLGDPVFFRHHFAKINPVGA